ncbi:MAG TPA: beta-ketoacyl synthase chain length factor [Casimicrobiaceae bacterium]|nr:beta-ketoacyl synthase chain length factor [Casimicrobiaceae bacterium]
MSLAARVEGVGLVGPGLASWQQARDVLGGRAPYAPARTNIPTPEALPAVERRRAGKGVRISLAAGLEASAAAGRDPREVGAVFASSTGDGENVHAICEMLASNDRLISPTRFHNSVHNAPSGYWGIATGSQRAADSLAAFDASFGAGIVEALSRLAAHPAEAVLLIAYDAPYPEPLNATRPIPDAFAVALALASVDETTRGPTITLQTGRTEADVLADPQLEELRRAIPAARSLPLLRLLANADKGVATLDYLEGLTLTLYVS